MTTVLIKLVMLQIAYWKEATSTEIQKIEYTLLFEIYWIKYSSGLWCVIYQQGFVDM